MIDANTKSAAYHAERSDVIGKKIVRCTKKIVEINASNPYRYNAQIINNTEMQAKGTPATVSCVRLSATAIINVRARAASRSRRKMMYSSNRKNSSMND